MHHKRLMIADRFGDWSRNGFAVLLQTLEVALDSVPNIRHCFVTGFPLRDATGQSRAFSNEDAVLVWFNYDAKLHRESLSASETVGNYAGKFRH